MQISLQELTTARSFLRQSHLLIAGAAGLFFNAGDSDTAAQLNKITVLLTDEIGHVDKRIDAAAKGGKP
ncbi:MAG: hypothetical protein WAN43_00635 [Rhodomicrobium sp.]